MTAENPGFFRKHGWLIYLVVILAILLLLYIDVKDHEDLPPGLVEEYQVEHVSPISDLVCVNCHSDLGDLGNELTVPGLDWYTSTHREAGTDCVDCHGGNALNSSDPMGGNFIGQPDRDHVAAMCGNCHYDVYMEYKGSIHSGYLMDIDTGEQTVAAVCTDCHGIHHIETHTNPESPVYVMNNPDTCAQCHDSKFYSFQDTYHGAYLVLGGELVANCSDCHGYHDVRPLADPESTIHPDNVAETCAKCHGNSLDVDVTQGYVHNEGEYGEREESYKILGFDLREVLPLVYKIALVSVIGLFVSLILLENYGRKLGKVITSRKKKEK